MSGPVPKPSAMRQRRNKVATRSMMEAEPDQLPTTATAKGEKVFPPLPARGRRKWNPMTTAWWDDVWRSPMADEFLRPDIHGLYILAELVDAFWRSPSVKLAGEIRQHRTAFGLTPIDRRRLQWEVERVNEKTSAKRGRQPPKRKRMDSLTDPRNALRAVK